MRYIFTGVTPNGDFEDAVHLFTMFEESLSSAQLERWVRKLDVEDIYDRLG